jgi:hypothetical protein
MPVAEAIWPLKTAKVQVKIARQHVRSVELLILRLCITDLRHQSTVRRAEEIAADRAIV